MYLKSHYQHLNVHRVNIWMFTKDSPEVVGDVAIPTKNVDVETSMKSAGEKIFH